MGEKANCRGSGRVRGVPGSWSCQNSLQQRTFPLSNPRVAIKWPLPQRPSKIPPSVSALHGAAATRPKWLGGTSGPLPRRVRRGGLGPSAVGGAINSRPSGAFQVLSNGQGLRGIGIGQDRRRHIHRNGSCAQERWPGPLCVCAKSLQSCLTLWDPMDCSPPGSSVHGILQARRLELVAMPFSRGSSRPRDREDT